MSMASEVANQRLRDAVRDVDGVNGVLDEAERAVATLISDKIISDMTQKQVTVFRWLQIKWCSLGLLGGALAVAMAFQVIHIMNRPAYLQALTGTEYEQLIGAINACHQSEGEAGAVLNCKMQAKGFLLTLDNPHARTVAMEVSHAAAQ